MGATFCASGTLPVFAQQGGAEDGIATLRTVASFPRHSPAHDSAFVGSVSNDSERRSY